VKLSVLLAAAIFAASALVGPAVRASTSPMRPQAVVAGVSVACRDFRGIAVHTVRVADLGDVGRAWLVNRIPMIVLDEKVLDRLPDKLQLFFYGHECAHHVLGHTVLYRPDRESEADCWAIKDGRDRGIFSRSEVESFAPFLAASRGSTITGHLPGPARAKHLLKCFDEP
jgi:hypothetical protein